MNPDALELRLKNTREALRGYPPGTVEAAESFLRDGDTVALDHLVDLVLTHYRPANPANRPVTALPPTAHLVSDVGLDSFAMIELSFLFDSLLEAKFSDEELRGLQTLGDLRAAVQAKAVRR